MKQPEVTCTCSPVTTFLPLIIVLGISIVKEAIEDFGRYRADREVNNRKVAVFSPAEGRFIDKAWKLVQVPASPCRSVALAGVRLLFGPGAFLRKAAQSLGLHVPATHGTRCVCGWGGRLASSGSSFCLTPAWRQLASGSDMQVHPSMYAVHALLPSSHCT